MKKNSFFKTVTKLLIIFAIFGFLTAMIDYLRMKSGEVPVINISKYNDKSRIQTYRGIFYKAERKVTVSVNEPLTDSSNMNFSILIFKLDVPRQFKELKSVYSLNTKEVENCQEPAKLYYADKDVKVYTYCLEDIKLTKDDKEETLLSYLAKDNTIIDEIDSELSYLGLHTDQSTLIFNDQNNISKTGLTMYKCNRPNINDVYIGPESMIFQSDFCTYKDDDFKFISTVVEEEKTTANTEEKQKEVIYEDEQYRYEFDEVKSDRIFIVTPAVRGKEEMRYPLRDIINGNVLTLEELAAKGLKYNKIDKIKEQEELLKKQQQEEQKNNQQ